MLPAAGLRPQTCEGHLNKQYMSLPCLASKSKGREGVYWLANMSFVDFKIGVEGREKIGIELTRGFIVVAGTARASRELQLSSNHTQLSRQESATRVNMETKVSGLSAGR